MVMWLMVVVVRCWVVLRWISVCCLLVVGLVCFVDVWCLILVV